MEVKHMVNSATASAVPPTAREAIFSPRVDILETEEGLVLYADFPGVKPEDADVQYHDGELVLHGKVTRRYGEAGRFLRGEYGVGDFHRTFTVKDIEVDKINAELKNGVLKVTLPKTAALKPKKIAVSGE
jgi:HSP20 family molecular chaperone IbpA